jgi:hypothetical protein
VLDLRFAPCLLQIFTRACSETARTKHSFPSTGRDCLSSRRRRRQVVHRPGRIGQRRQLRRQHHRHPHASERHVARRIDLQKRWSHWAGRLSEKRRDAASSSCARDSAGDEARSGTPTSMRAKTQASFIGGNGRLDNPATTERSPPPMPELGESRRWEVKRHLAQSLGFKPFDSAVFQRGRGSELGGGATPNPSSRNRKANKWFDKRKTLA